MVEATQTKSINGKVKARASKTLLGEIDARISSLEKLVGKTATKRDVAESERRIIEHIDAVVKGVHAHEQA